MRRKKGSKSGRRNFGSKSEADGDDGSQPHVHASPVVGNTSELIASTTLMQSGSSIFSAAGSPTSTGLRARRFPTPWGREGTNTVLVPLSSTGPGGSPTSSTHAAVGLPWTSRPNSCAEVSSLLAPRLRGNNSMVEMYFGGSTQLRSIGSGASIADQRVTVIYPNHDGDGEYGETVKDGGKGVMGREEDEEADHGLQANLDLCQVRVEGYFNRDAGVLIPSDLPQSTVLYVLTASDGRDCMFKMAQYALQGAICFLKSPALLSPDAAPFIDPWADRFFRNYNTIRHGRSLFKMGRGLLNLFTLQSVCERMWMRYGDGVRRRVRPASRRVVGWVLWVGRALGMPMRKWEARFIAADPSGGAALINGLPPPSFLRAHAEEDALLTDDMYVHITSVECGPQGPSPAAPAMGGKGKRFTTDRFVASDTHGAAPESVKMVIAMSPTTSHNVGGDDPTGQHGVRPFYVRSTRASFLPATHSLQNSFASPRGPDAVASESTGNYSIPCSDYTATASSPVHPSPSASADLRQASSSVPQNACFANPPSGAEDEHSSDNPSSSSDGSRRPTAADPPMVSSTLPQIFHDPQVGGGVAQAGHMHHSAPPLLRPTMTENETEDTEVATTPMFSQAGPHTGMAVGGAEEYDLCVPPAHRGRGCPPFEESRTAVSGGDEATDGTSSPGAEQALEVAAATNGGSGQLQQSSGDSEDFSMSSGDVCKEGDVGVDTYDRNHELVPASAAAPARCREPITQFNPVIMTLLGVRSLAAAIRRFLRDLTLLSSERFFHLGFVEANRLAIHKQFNYMWLVVSIIDLLLNTIRLLQPGWRRYAMARQNVRCRCGCVGDENPNDVVWRQDGYVVRRKSDLHFPALNLDFGAPFASNIAYMEAANPGTMAPACSRCGYLYKEVSQHYTSSEQREDGKPRWVQVYDQERAHQVDNNFNDDAIHAALAVASTANANRQARALLRIGAASGAVGVVQGPLSDAVEGSEEDGVGEVGGKRSIGFLFIPWIMRKLFNYVWLVRVHTNLTSTLLLEARYIAELYLAYKYCFGGYEPNCTDAPMEQMIHPTGALAGFVSAAVGLLRVIESAS